jgi:hypothetical protein
MARKKRPRKSREEIVEELLRTDENFRRLKERIDYFDAKLGKERRESS